MLSTVLSGVDHMNSNAVSEKKSSICPVLWLSIFKVFICPIYIDVSDSQNHRLNIIKFHIRCFGSTMILLYNKYRSSKRTHRRQVEISSVDQRHHLPRVKLAPEETAEKDKQQL